MVLVCRQRHRIGRVSIDRGTLRWEALDPELGAEGPIAWFVDGAAVGYPAFDEIELAREVRPGRLQELTPGQHHILDGLLKEFV